MRLSCVGIACVDVIQTVARYPIEDSESRVEAVRRTRGGNATNTLCVAAQIPGIFPRWIGVALSPTAPDPGAQIIARSLEASKVDSRGSPVLDAGHVPTSWIISNSETGSRTILHYRDLPELTFNDFISSIARDEARPEVDRLCDKLCDKDATEKILEELREDQRLLLLRATASIDWLHFECRHAKETLPMMLLMDSVRRWRGEDAQGNLSPVISLEVEKDRGPLADAMVAIADLVVAPRELGHVLRLPGWGASSGASEGGGGHGKSPIIPESSGSRSDGGSSAAAGMPPASTAGADSATASAPSASPQREPPPLLQDPQVEALARYLRPRCRPGAAIVLTWGSRGAVGVCRAGGSGAGNVRGKPGAESSALPVTPLASKGGAETEAVAAECPAALRDFVHVPAWVPRGGVPVDTVGAGDTFIAGLLWGLWRAGGSGGADSREKGRATGGSGDSVPGDSPKAAGGGGGEEGCTSGSGAETREEGLDAESPGVEDQSRWDSSQLLLGLQSGVRLAGAKVCMVGLDGVAEAAGLA